MKHLNKILVPSFVVFMAFNYYSFAQDKTNDQKGVSFSKSYIDKEFSEDKVFDKYTGKKLEKSVINRLISENPRLIFEKVFDDEGRVIKYLYDEAVQGIGPQNISKPKGSFGRFKFTTIDNKKIGSQDLIGNLVLIRFAVFPDMFHHKKHEIEALDKMINSSPNKENIKAFILFNGSKQEIRTVFQYKNSNFIPVGNAMNFMQKFGIKRFPKTLVINQEGELIDKFSYSEDIDLNNYFE